MTKTKLQQRTGTSTVMLSKVHVCTHFFETYRINWGQGIVHEILIPLGGVDCIAKANVAVVLATITTSTAHTNISRLQNNNNNQMVDIHCTAQTILHLILCFKTRTLGTSWHHHSASPQRLCLKGCQRYSPGQQSYCTTVRLILTCGLLAECYSFTTAPTKSKQYVPDNYEQKTCAARLARMIKTVTFIIRIYFIYNA